MKLKNDDGFDKMRSRIQAARIAKRTMTELALGEEHLNPGIGCDDTPPVDTGTAPAGNESPTPPDTVTAVHSDEASAPMETASTDCTIL